MEKNRYVIAADIGGSHITAAVVDLRDKLILTDSYCRSAIDAQGYARDIINKWVDNLRLSCQESGLQPDRLSIAMPSPFDYDKGISYMLENSKYKTLYGLNIKDLLSEQLGIASADILIKNDTACFLAGEMFAVL